MRNGLQTFVAKTRKSCEIMCRARYLRDPQRTQLGAPFGTPVVAGYHRNLAVGIRVHDRVRCLEIGRHALHVVVVFQQVQ